MDVGADLGVGDRVRLGDVPIQEAVDRQLVSREAAGAEVVERRAVERVRARPQDQVQGAAGEVAVLDVEGRGLDHRLLDRFRGHRAAVGGQAAGVQAETVGRAHAVDGDPVGPRRGPGDVEAAGGAGRAGVEVELGQRVAAGDVADVPPHRHDGFDVLAPQGGLRTDVGELGRRADARRRHSDGGHLVGGSQHQPQPLLVAHRQIDVVDGLLARAGGRDADPVGPADAQPRGVEAARVVGHESGVGRGRQMRDGDGRALDRRALGVDHRAADRARRLLGVGAGCGQGERKGARRGPRSEIAHEAHLQRPPNLMITVASNLGRRR